MSLPHKTQASICYTNNVSCHLRLIVCKYLLTDQVFDQLAYKPTGSTTSALIALIASFLVPGIIISN